MKLSAFGKKFSRRSGIVELMEDLGDIPATHPDMVSMGGGNPARIPAVIALLKERMQAMLADQERFYRVFGAYQSPQGDPLLRQRLAAWFREHCQWQISGANIAITNGGQSTFFMLANMLAGDHGTGYRQLMFPLVPEYLGYKETGLSEPFFRAIRPRIERLDDRLFKYAVDFEHLDLDDSVAGIVVSRPTNPTGNVVTANELDHLDALARQYDIPLILDCAYGLPFPGIDFTGSQPYFSANTVLMLSLSKLGLPGLRSGLLIGPEELVARFSAINGLINLASGNLGAYLLVDLLESGDMLSLANDSVRPFYLDRMQRALALFRQYLGRTVPYHIHKPEGALFLWLWFEGLPVDSRELYERLKARGVLVIPGNECFPGLDEDWSHTRQCVRVSYALADDAMERGISLIADEVNRLYGADSGRSCH